MLNLSQDRWIDTRLYVFNVPSSQVESTKTKLLVCTLGLGWDIFTENNHNDKVDVYASTKNHKMSPLEIESLQSKIGDAVNKIAKNFHSSKEGAIIIQLTKD